MESTFNTSLYEVTILATHLGGYFGILPWHCWLTQSSVIEYSSPNQATRAGHRGKLPPACAVIVSGTAGEHLKLLAASRPREGGWCNQLYCLAKQYTQV